MLPFAVLFRTRQAVVTLLLAVAAYGALGICLIMLHSWVAPPDLANDNPHFTSCCCHRERELRQA